MTFTPGCTPAPKPEKRVKPQKTPKVRKPLKSAGRIKPHKRSPSEFARIYGSKERRAYVASLPCVTTWRDDWWKFRGPHDFGNPLYAGTGTACKGKMENAHTVSGGTGRKADANTIVPACHHHHAEMHRGVETFAQRYGLNLTDAALATEAAWLAHNKHREVA